MAKINIPFAITDLGVIYWKEMAAGVAAGDLEDISELRGHARQACCQCEFKLSLNE